MHSLEKSLFVNLLKYRPRDGIKPKENFFTEIVRFVLDNDDVLTKQFLEKMGVKTSSKSFVVTSQEDYGTAIPDLVIKQSNGIKILVEVKVESSANTEQIIRHIKTGKGRVCLISKRNEDDVSEELKKNKNHAQHYIGGFQWSEFYEIFRKRSEKLSNKSHQHFVLQELLMLMENLSMKPFQNFSDADLKIAKNDSFGKDFHRIFGQVISLFEHLKKDSKKIQKFCEDNGYDLSISSPSVKGGFYQIILRLTSIKNKENHYIEFWTEYWSDSDDMKITGENEKFVGLACGAWISLRSKEFYKAFKSFEKENRFEINSNNYKGIFNDEFSAFSIEEHGFNDFIKDGYKSAENNILTILKGLKKNGVLDALQNPKLK